MGRRVVVVSGGVLGLCVYVRQLDVGEVFVCRVVVCLWK